MVSRSKQAETVTRPLEGWVEGVGALQREMLEFVAVRLEKDSSAIKSAIASDNLGEALTVQQRWAAETVQDYLIESTKFVSLLARQGSAFPQLGAEALTEAAETVKAEVEAAPKRAAS